jgi:hypothetical protein
MLTARALRAPGAHFAGFTRILPDLIGRGRSSISEQVLSVIVRFSVIAF